MKTNKKIKSVENNQDVFGNPGPFDIDHKWPLSKGGSNIKENLIKLSKISNNSKAEKTKGKINEIRFSVEVVLTKLKNNEQSKYGKLYVFKNGEWYEVTSW